MNIQARGKAQDLTKKSIHRQIFKRIKQKYSILQRLECLFAQRQSRREEDRLTVEKYKLAEEEEEEEVADEEDKLPDEV